MIHRDRVQLLSRGGPRKGDYVLYWMQASPRIDSNHALEFAVRQANERRLPLLVFFGLTPRFPEAASRAYHFLLEGLRDVERGLRERRIGFVARRVEPDRGALALGRRAGLIVVDRSYTRLERAWRDRVADRAACPVIQVETNVVVPVEAVSEKEEYAAATLRPKLKRLLKDFLVPLDVTEVKKPFPQGDFESLDLSDPARVAAALPVDKRVGRSPLFTGGETEARKRLDRFIRRGLEGYDGGRNDPALEGTSRLSPYLHFGHISPLAVALRVRKAGGDGPAAEAFLEELVVRRELAVNFVLHNPRYDAYEGLPAWCRKTLARHRREKRPYLYTARELETGRTHDPYWNAAQKQMVRGGWMHGYMRMYWGKKILEWSRTPEEAFRTALRLNNRYELDGRDPNGFAGVAWCFGKHDRPWGERRVFGLVRYMNEAGLKRKFDADRYVKTVAGRFPDEEGR
ncbi:MAG: deoxyribodipyrimidine photo-lyase [Candidatus Aminicenantes bacterium]|nr:deoxyribodipyrimidine photo-lyase [Candidatus Aminicenantes bacterium]